MYKQNLLLSASHPIVTCLKASNHVFTFCTLTMNAVVKVLLQIGEGQFCQGRSQVLCLKYLHLAASVYVIYCKELHSESIISY